MLIIGKPGSGKSTILQELLLNSELLKDKFTSIIIFSPTKLEYLDLKEGENWFLDFSLDKIFETIEILNNEFCSTKKKCLIYF